MASRGRGNPSYRGGRGNTSNRGERHNYYGNQAIIAQHGQQKLIASDISGLSKSDYDKEIEEFKAWKSMQKQGNTPSSSTASPLYAKAGVEYHYIQNSNTQVILLLNEKDKKWEKEPQVLYTRYLSPHGYTMETYKTRIYYEQILANNGCEFAHFSSSGKGKEVYNFSKILIQRVIPIEDWGISPFTEKILINNENGNTIKYNYWDYIQAFDKVFTYENPGFTHTWFIKIYSNIIDSFIPSWFINWWNFMGTKKEILPGEIRQYYDEWVQVKPDLMTDYTLPDEMRFFIEYSIPWIWKFTIETTNHSDGYFCLIKRSSTRFWEKMIRKDETTGQLNCQSTIDQLKTSIESYKDLQEHKKTLQQQERIEYLAKLSDGDDLDANASEQEIIEAYMMAMKKVLKAKKEEDQYLAKYTKKDEDDKKSATSDVSMNSNTSQGLFQDAQHEEDDIDIEETLRKFLENKEKTGK